MGEALDRLVALSARGTDGDGDGILNESRKPKLKTPTYGEHADMEAVYRPKFTQGVSGSVDQGATAKQAARLLFAGWKYPPSAVTEVQDRLDALVKKGFLTKKGARYFNVEKPFKYKPSNKQ